LKACETVKKKLEQKKVQIEGADERKYNWRQKGFENSFAEILNLSSQIEIVFCANLVKLSLSRN